MRREKRGLEMGVARGIRGKEKKKRGSSHGQGKRERERKEKKENKEKKEKKGKEEKC
jgi:hypothetical protein